MLIRNELLSKEKRSIGMERREGIRKQHAGHAGLHAIAAVAVAVEFPR